MLNLYVGNVESAGILYFHSLNNVIEKQEENVTMSDLSFSENAFSSISLSSADHGKIMQVDITQFTSSNSFHGIVLVPNTELKVYIASKEGDLQPLILVSHDIGVAAKKWHTGSNEPAQNLGNVGDLYLDVENGDVFIKNTNEWKVSCNIVGPAGQQGPQGEQGVAGAGGVTYSVGDFAQGGIIFWVDETRQHGLVCAKWDQRTNVRWFAGTYGNTQARGDGPYAGEANTAIIIAAQVAIGDDGGTYAARICNELQIAVGGKTYGDWYLPSKEELDLMYTNKVKIDATAVLNGGVVFSNELYWSSTEEDSNIAWGQSFGDGGHYYTTKHYQIRVRAVRAF